MLRGEPAALRRLLGARRAGRWGIAMAGGALLAAAPWRALPLLLVLDLALSVLAAGLGSAGALLASRQHQRLVLWFIAPLATAALPLRMLWPASALPAALAVLAAHGWLWAILRRGGLEESRG